MRSIFLRGLLSLTFLGLSACGGGGGGGASSASDTPPIANFAYACSDLVCTFTSTSTDQDVGDAIASFSWTFGDGSAAATASSTQHAFPASNTFSVSLSVTDRLGIASSVTRQVTVTAPPAPAAPHAAFTASCQSLVCTFTDTSTYDAGSVFQSRVWDFGDSTTLATTNPAVHTYAATTLTTVTAKLTITDGAGKTSASSQSVIVSPPASTLNCVGGGCVLTLLQATKVTATLVSSSCSLRGNEVLLTAPVTQTIFADGCFDPVGSVVSLNGGNAFAANTTLAVSVLSGTTSGLVYPPSIRVSGDFASGWTLTFDDGVGGPGEPDFNDLVILIKAAP